MMVSESPDAWNIVIDTPAQAAARAWLHSYGINTSRYRDMDGTGDHPAMATLPAAFEAFARQSAEMPKPLPEPEG